MITVHQSLFVAIPVGRNCSVTEVKSSFCDWFHVLSVPASETSLVLQQGWWGRCDSSLGPGQVMCPSAELWVVFVPLKAVESRWKGVGFRRRGPNSGKVDCFWAWWKALYLMHNRCIEFEGGRDFKYNYVLPTGRFACNGLPNTWTSPVTFPVWKGLCLRNTPLLCPPGLTTACLLPDPSVRPALCHLSHSLNVRTSFHHTGRAQGRQKGRLCCGTGEAGNLWRVVSMSLGRGLLEGDQKALQKQWDLAGSWEDEQESPSTQRENVILVDLPSFL